MPSLAEVAGLSPEEIEALRETDGEGTTETPPAEPTVVEGESRPPAEEEGESPPATTGEELPPPAEGTEEKPGVLSKDGKHVIPYSELETARQTAAEERDKRVALEAKLEAAKPAERPAAAPDKFEQFRTMTSAQIREYEAVATDDELALLDDFREVKAVERTRRELQIEKDMTLVDAFRAEHTELFSDPIVTSMFDAPFLDLQRQGKTVAQALDVIKDRMTKIGLIKPAAATLDPAKVAEGLQRMESRAQIPASLSGKGGAAPIGARGNLDSLPLDEAEAVINSMSPQAKDKYLRGL